MITKLVMAPTGAVVDIGLVKMQLNITWDNTDDDFYLESLIQSATAQAENITNRKLLTQTWKAFADEWPTARFLLPFGNLQSVTSVKYKGSDGVEYTFSSSDYIVDIDSDPGRVVLGYEKLWPTVTLYPSNPIYIQFVCGYGTEANVPYPIKAAILIMVADAYAHRESIIVGNNQSVDQIPGHIMNLLWPYRLFNFGG